MNKITLIGSGNVAYHLAKMMMQNNLPISQIFGRNEVVLKSISEEVGIPYSTQILEEADLYIISVKDSAVAEISSCIKNENALVVHTSGSLPMEILKGNYRKGVFYPLQTFSKTKALDYTKIPFFIETENPNDEKILTEIAQKISGKVSIANSERRKHLHLAAVFACNFVNHLFTRAKEITDNQGIPFEYLIPLVEETIEKIRTIEPKLAQTGPAVRNDQKVMDLHRELIHSNEVLELYNTLNNSILKMYHKDY